jgi:membrane-associated protein
MPELFDSFANAVSGSNWAYLVIFGLAFLDAFFPLVPSETAVITGGVLAGSGDLSIVLVVLAAAAGAFAGDNFTYGIGKFVGRRAADVLFRGERAQRSLKWVTKSLEERGAILIVVARFIPGGRTATMFVCGLTGYDWRRFVVLTAFAGTLWALYAALLGYAGGKTFEEKPWAGLLIAFAIAGALTLTYEVVRRLRSR